MVVYLLKSLVTKISGSKNLNNDTKVVFFIIILNLVTIGRPMSLLMENFMVWIFANPKYTLPKGVPIRSPVIQGTILFKISSHISPKYVATFITNKQGFYFNMEYMQLLF